MTRNPYDLVERAKRPDGNGWRLVECVVFDQPCPAWAEITWEKEAGDRVVRTIPFETFDAWLSRQCKRVKDAVGSGCLDLLAEVTHDPLRA